MRVAHRTALAGVITWILSSPAGAKVWYITPDGSGDAATIQAAIDAAAPGDEVLLAAGTYAWTAQGGDHVGLPGPSMINMRSGVTLISESGPEVTILDAEGQGRVIRCEGNTNVRIEGFTIQGGYTTNPDGTGPGGDSKGVGGGILCRFGLEIVIANNVLRNNRAQYLGGGVGAVDATLQLQENIVSGNRADGRGGGIDVAGGSANATILSNTIAANIGGGVACALGSATIVQNLLTENLSTSIGSGGWGVYCFHANVVFTCNNSWANEEIDNCAGSIGNMTQDPLTCVTSTEYHLQPGSPCLPENNGCGVLIGARGVGCTTTDRDDERTPSRHVRISASPNPFNPQTRINYSVLSVADRVELTIHDLRGRRVARLADSPQTGTERSVIWDGRDDGGQPTATGVYIARLSTRSDVTTVKLVLLK